MESQQGQGLDLSQQLDSMDMSGVETGFPVMRPGVVQFQVSAMELVENKSRKGSSNLKITLKTTEATVNVKTGETINPGFPIFHTIGLTQTEKYDPRKNLAQFMEAVLGHKNGTIKPFEQFIGQSLTARVKVESSEQYGDQNRIDAFIKKG